MPKFTVFDNTKNIDEMTYLGSIDIHSTCSHHFKSFSGKAYIAYLPGDKLVGISKLARIADWFARRPQVQEELTAEIADFLVEQLQPKGLGVHINAVHNCIRVRGAKQSSSVMKTTALRGCFKTDKTTSDEFMWMIKSDK
jgi:GTP cyclohydrolase I